MFFFITGCKNNIVEEQSSGKIIDIEELGQKGVEILENFSADPDSNGVLSTYEIKVPEFNNCTYFTKRR